MNITLTRSFKTDKVTMGMLEIKGVDHAPIFTLELPWEYNKKNLSCIPVGKYECAPHTGSKYKNVWRLSGVDNRAAILIHAGNITEDTEGCILVGLSAGELGREPAVLKSKAAINYLRLLLGKEKFIIQIK